MLANWQQVIMTKTIYDLMMMMMISNVNSHELRGSELMCSDYIVFISESFVTKTCVSFQEEEKEADEEA